MDISRRTFLGGSLAALARPALAGDGQPALRFGFLTDTHVDHDVASCARVRKALELFRSKGVELIVHTGDVANAHYPDGYRAYRRCSTRSSPASRCRVRSRPSATTTRRWG